MQRGNPNTFIDLWSYSKKDYRCANTFNAYTLAKSQQCGYANAFQPIKLTSDTKEQKRRINEILKDDLITTCIYLLEKIFFTRNTNIFQENVYKFVFYIVCYMVIYRYRSVCAVYCDHDSWIFTSLYILWRLNYCSWLQLRVCRKFWVNCPSKKYFVAHLAWLWSSLKSDSTVSEYKPIEINLILCRQIIHRFLSTPFDILFA